MPRMRFSFTPDQGMRLPVALGPDRGGKFPVALAPDRGVKFPVADAALKNPVAIADRGHHAATTMPRAPCATTPSLAVDGRLSSRAGRATQPRIRAENSRSRRPRSKTSRSSSPTRPRAARRGRGLEQRLAARQLDLDDAGQQVRQDGRVVGDDDPRRARRSRRRRLDLDRRSIRRLVVDARRPRSVAGGSLVDVSSSVGARPRPGCRAPRSSRPRAAHQLEVADEPADGEVGQALGPRLVADLVLERRHVGDEVRLARRRRPPRSRTARSPRRAGRSGRRDSGRPSRISTSAPTAGQSDGRAARPTSRPRGSARHRTASPVSRQCRVSAR